MEVKTIQQITARSAVASVSSAGRKIQPVAKVAPVTTISAQATKFIETVSASQRLTSSEKSSLIDTAAMIDTFLNNPEGRQKMYRDLAGLNVYMEEMSETDKIPRWPVLTGLRFYGGVKQELIATKSILNADAKAAISQRMEMVAQQSRNVSMEQVKTHMKAKPVEVSAKQIASSIGHAVDTVVKGVDAPKAQPIKTDTTV